jgi:hypothetical protein
LFPSANNHLTESISVGEKEGAFVMVAGEMPLPEKAGRISFSEMFLFIEAACMEE